MDMRIGRTPLPTTQLTSPITLTSPDPDGNPSGSQSGSWGFERSNETPSRGSGLAAITDGGPDSAPTTSHLYLTAMYEQYVDYRGPKRGTLENPLSPASVTQVQTVAMNPGEGAVLDVQV